MSTRGIRGLAALCVIVALACVFAGSRISRWSTASRADEDPSASLIGSWRGTRKAPGTIAVRHNLLSFMPGGIAMEAGPSVYMTGGNFGNGAFVETSFVGTWVSEGHGNFVAHLIANISEPPVSKGTPIGTENLTFRFHMENGKNGKELKGTLEGIFLDMEGNTLAQMPAGLTWEATPLTITSNGYN
ncbi:MAG TPA: hypothetical protein VK709_07625 [Candidatus Saccharimonadales bacterium]|nr:hypothetical protein [Candidatus Saccharimonadales bacterium]